VFKVHVKDGIITRIETDDGDEPQLRACLRGRAYRQRVYSPDRANFPLKRVGARGEGRFERITWDEALDTVAKELIRVRDTYGPASILYEQGGGDIAQIHNARQFHNVLCRFGGYSRPWGSPSFQGGLDALQGMYGYWRTSSSRDDLLNSRFILLWGFNPASTICGTNTSWYLAQAREAGARVVAIDPRYHNTAAVLADQWIPIIPGTDAAMLIAMAYTIIEENLQDQAFLDKYTIGFEQYKDYVLGKEDGKPKTPAWAEAITGVPATTIAHLAREYAITKPAALLAGIAPGRTAYGEQYHRAAITLVAMTGNIGIHGGEAGARSWEGGSWYPYKIRYGVVNRPEEATNPLLDVKSDGRLSTYIAAGVHRVHLADFVARGKSGGYPADLKLGFFVNCNWIQQMPNINKIVPALKDTRLLEFIVVIEQFKTATANFADIVLPTTTHLERNDIYFGVGTPYYCAVNKAIEPLHESRNHVDIARELGVRLGVTDFTVPTEDQLLKNEIADSEIADYDEFRQQGIYRFQLKEPYIAFKKQIDDPVNNPFPTRSGKIEIYAAELAKQNNPERPAVPKYIETWESRNDPLAKKYPLQMINTHFRRRTHGQFDTLPWLRELEAQAMLINSADARARGIRNGDIVRVFNDRGEVMIQAEVTERIVPGVVDIPQGAWYDPDENGVDRGGNPNVLTKEQISPAGAFPYNTCLVQVQKL